MVSGRILAWVGGGYGRPPRVESLSDRAQVAVGGLSQTSTTQPAASCWSGALVANARTGCWDCDGNQDDGKVVTEVCRAFRQPRTARYHSGLLRSRDSPPNLRVARRTDGLAASNQHDAHLERTQTGDPALSVTSSRHHYLLRVSGEPLSGESRLFGRSWSPTSDPPSSIARASGLCRPRDRQMTLVSSHSRDRSCLGTPRLLEQDLA